jgi:opacity protein-like surface antigen
MLKKLCLPSVVAVALTLAAATDVRAQGFFIPMIGYDYGGDSGCPNLTGCEDKKLNFGVALGKLGSSAGFEQEFAYAKNFFGSTTGQGSSVLTIMSNVLIAPKIGPVRPYVLFGVGLMKSHVDLTPSALVSFSNNNFGWDLGGGLMVMFGKRVGIRGDVRQFSSFQDVKILTVLSDTKLNFSRASAGLVLMY